MWNWALPSDVHFLEYMLVQRCSSELHRDKDQGNIQWNQWPHLKELEPPEGKFRKIQRQHFSP